MSLRAQCQQQLEKMIFLLEAEIKQIRAGDFSNLETQSKSKLTGIKQLDQLLSQLTDYEDKAALANLISRLNRVSNENGILLKSIYNGSKAAQKRLQTLRENEENVGIYGRDGQAVRLPESYITNEKSV